MTSHSNILKNHFQWLQVNHWYLQHLPSWQNGYRLLQSGSFSHPTQENKNFVLQQSALAFCYILTYKTFIKLNFNKKLPQTPALQWGFVSPKFFLQSFAESHSEIENYEIACKRHWHFALNRPILILFYLTLQFLTIFSLMKSSICSWIVCWVQTATIEQAFFWCKIKSLAIDVLCACSFTFFHFANMVVFWVWKFLFVFTLPSFTVIQRFLFHENMKLS